MKKNEKIIQKDVEKAVNNALEQRENKKKFKRNNERIGILALVFWFLLLNVHVLLYNKFLEDVPNIVSLTMATILTTCFAFILVLTILSMDWYNEKLYEEEVKR